jgi:hypothetical protein
MDYKRGNRSFSGITQRESARGMDYGYGKPAYSCPSAMWIANSVGRQRGAQGKDLTLVNPQRIEK